MIADPLRRMPERVRLAVAAVLCLAPMGLVWSVGVGLQGPGMLIDGDCGYDEDTYVCNPTEYVQGLYQPGHTTLVSQSPARVFLVVAALALAVIVLQVARGARAELALKVAAGALALAAVVAAEHGVGRVLACVLIALALVVPLLGAPRTDDARAVRASP